MLVLSRASNKEDPQLRDKITRPSSQNVVEDSVKNTLPSTLIEKAPKFAESKSVFSPNIVTTPNAAGGDSKQLPSCLDPVWCNIEMPKASYYRFDPPVDPFKWRVAQLQASRGDHVLLERIMKHFPGHSDFLDGDISFRSLHSIFDVFVDQQLDLTPLVPPGSVYKSTVKPNQFAQRKLAQTDAKMINGKLQYPWQLEGKRVIPEPYDFRSANRSAIVSIGYSAYTRDSQTYFSGNLVGGAFIDRNLFFQYWRKVKDKIDLPFTSICTLNENWGMLSTMFPNRTAGWGRCCDQPKDKIVHEFLDHPKTLMLVTNQHVNISHPKLLIMPRGIPLTWGYTRKIIWDAMRNTLLHRKKDKLLFAAASSWGPRPQILACISQKVPPELFDGHIRTPKTNRLSREQYYEKLGSTMFGVGLPGLGYDTFRYTRSRSSFSLYFINCCAHINHVVLSLLIVGCAARGS
jgi:hypothetical protein